MERHDGLSYLQYFYFLGLSRIKHITLKLGLIEPWLKSNFISKNQKYWKKNLDPEITLYLKTLNMQMTPQNQLFFDKSLYDLYPCKKKVVLPQINKRKTRIYSPTCCWNLQLKEHNIISSN
jgi:hypothetical protein